MARAPQAPHAKTTTSNPSKTHRPKLGTNAYNQLRNYSKQKKESKNVYPSPKIVNIHEIVHINRKHVTCNPHIVVQEIIITRTSLSRQNAPNRAECWEFDATIKSHKCCTLVKLQSR